MSAANVPGGPVAGRLLDNRVALVLVLALIALAGMAAWSNLPRIEDPRITTRNATVLTALPGADAARIEALVAKPLEDAIREVAEVKTIESTSRAGMSLISVELDDTVTKANNREVFSRIRDKLTDAVVELPPEATTPSLDDQRGAVAFSIVAALTWDGPGAPPLGMLTRLGDELGDRLRALGGTEQVVAFGQASEEIRVTVDPAELAALGLRVTDVSAALSDADPKLSAGALRTGSRTMQLEVAGQFDAPDRIARVPLRVEGRGKVTIGDIAKVERVWRDPPADMAFADGKRAVLIGVRAREAVHLDKWTRSARQVVNAFGETLGSGVSVSVRFDQSEYTTARLRDLGGNLAAGAGVVMLVVFIMMGWRSALVVAAALPLSTAIALFGLDIVGQQIHQMSIFGMIIAIGLLIDNAIVMTEEVSAQLRSGHRAAAAVERAVRHLAAPLTASTFTTILGFMPIFLLPGNVGDFVRPIAVAVILALLASLLVAMTLIPTLAAIVLKPVQGGARAGWWRDGLHAPRLSGAYKRLLTGALSRPVVTLSLCLALPFAGFGMAGSLGNQFFPAADRDQFEVQLWMAPGTAVERTAATALEVEQWMRADEAVRAVTWVAGASSPPVYYNQLRNQDGNAAYARATVLAESPAAAKRLVAALQAPLTEEFPSARIVVRAFGQGPPIPAPVSLRVVGPDTATLNALGERVRGILHQIPEITHTAASIQGGAPKVWLDIDEAEARLAGLRLRDVARQFAAATEGAVGGSVLEDLENLPVRVRYAGDDRASATDLTSMRLVAPGQPGTWLPADAIGRLELKPEPASITRRDGERLNTVRAWIHPDALPIEVASAVTRAMRDADFALPAGYRLEMAGDSEEQGEAVALLLAYAPLLGALMFAALVLTFRSFAIGTLIAFVAALSAGLGLLSLWIGGYPLGFNPMLGTAGLVGVAVNASIVVLAAIRADAAARHGDIAAIVARTRGATRHIVSTTLTTIGGFAPLVLLSGGDFWPPLAVVIAGGVGFSIILGLMLTPTAYVVLCRLGLAGVERPATSDSGTDIPDLHKDVVPA
ncbi:MAG: efflux RND transporter permease subunit [Pseudomonadota bacterium]